MKRLSRIAAVALVLCLPAGVALAQNPPAGSDQQAPAASPAPAPAPAASPSPASPAPAASPTTTENKPTATKKKRASGPSRKDIDKSIQSGTVPSRYRSQVPKEYQQYIPFEK